MYMYTYNKHNTKRMLSIVGLADLLIYVATPSSNTHVHDVCAYPVWQSDVDVRTLLPFTSLPKY